jgi:hypothetical protein
MRSSKKNWEVVIGATAGFFIAWVFLTLLCAVVVLGFFYMIFPPLYRVFMETPLFTFASFFVILGILMVPLGFNMAMGRLGDTSPHRSRRVPDSVKRYVYERDGGRCRQCYGTTDLEYDHIVPFSQGGNNSANNIRLLCRDCNRRRGGRGGGWF